MLFSKLTGCSMGKIFAHLPAILHFGVRVTVRFKIVVRFSVRVNDRVRVGMVFSIMVWLTLTIQS